MCHVLMTSIKSISNQERLNYCLVKYACSVYLSKNLTWWSFDTGPNLPWDLYLLGAVCLALIIEVWIITIRVSWWRATLLARFIAHQMAGRYQIDSSVCLQWRPQWPYIEERDHGSNYCMISITLWHFVKPLEMPLVFCVTYLIYKVCGAVKRFGKGRWLPKQLQGCALTADTWWAQGTGGTLESPSTEGAWLSEARIISAHSQTTTLNGCSFRGWRCTLSSSSYYITLMLLHLSNL